MKKRAEKGVKYVQHWIMVKAILICFAIIPIVVAAIALPISHNTAWLGFLGMTGLMGLLYLSLRITFYRGKIKEVRLLDDKIIVYERKKRYEYGWDDIDGYSIDPKASFAVSEILDHLLSFFIVRHLYKKVKLYFGSQEDNANEANRLNEIEIDISNRNFAKIIDKLPKGSEN
ncbi:MAG: hypothetical protein LBL66_05510 [Clostridiales bacterium]|jgi:hypothetical protein|nr:hypothetical protein [Clostridiales bacterium]